MARARSFANVAACCAGAGFSAKYHVSLLSIFGHYFDVVSMGKTLYPHMLHMLYVRYMRTHHYYYFKDKNNIIGVR